MLKSIVVSNNTGMPKYQQLAEGILNYIKEGKATLNERLPSVKDFSEELNVSRETVFKALNILSERGIIRSSNRKGYYISKTNVAVSYRVLLMLDKMTPFKNLIYESLRANLADDSEIDVYFHHGNNKVFKSIIRENLSAYSHFVISTFLDKEDDEVTHLLNSIPKGKLVLIDRHEEKIDEKHSQVYQDFEFDIYNLLLEAGEQINHYPQIKLVAAETAPHREPVINGFVKFCKECGLNFKVLDTRLIPKIEKGCLYVLIGAYDDNLVNIVKFARSHGYKLGQEVGVISYNDTQMKEVLEGGITVISTDFSALGRRVAELIMTGEKTIERNPSSIIVRNSL